MLFTVKLICTACNAGQFKNKTQISVVETDASEVKLCWSLGAIYTEHTDTILVAIFAMRQFLGFFHENNIWQPTKCKISDPSSSLIKLMCDTVSYFHSKTTYAMRLTHLHVLLECIPTLSYTDMQKMSNIYSLLTGWRCVRHVCPICKWERRGQAGLLFCLGEVIFLFI